MGIYTHMSTKSIRNQTESEKISTAYRPSSLRDPSISPKTHSNKMSQESAISSETHEDESIEDILIMSEHVEGNSSYLESLRDHTENKTQGYTLYIMLAVLLVISVVGAALKGWLPNPYSFFNSKASQTEEKKTTEEKARLEKEGEAKIIADAMA